MRKTHLTNVGYDLRRTRIRDSMCAFGLEDRGKHEIAKGTRTKGHRENCGNASSAQHERTGRGREALQDKNDGNGDGRAEDICEIGPIDLMCD